MKVRVGCESEAKSMPSDFIALEAQMLDAIQYPISGQSLDIANFAGVATYAMSLPANRVLNERNEFPWSHSWALDAPHSVQNTDQPLPFIIRGG